MEIFQSLNDTRSSSGSRKQYLIKLGYKTNPCMLAHVKGFMCHFSGKLSFSGSSPFTQAKTDRYNKTT